MTNELMTAERAYLEALRAAGPMTGTPAEHLARIEALADGVYRGARSFTEKIESVVRSIEMRGVVLSVDMDPMSEGGRKLNFVKVSFKSDIGDRPDHMWLDKTKPSDLAMGEVAKSLEGQRAHIIKESRGKFFNGVLETDTKGDPKVRPYLAFIEAEAEGEPATESAGQPAPTARTTRGASKAAAAKAPAAAKRATTARGAKPSLGEMLKLQPATAAEVVSMCQDHFGMSEEDVLAQAAIVLKGSHAKRKADCIKVWNVICHARCVAAAA
jgi:hypothetical protein